MLASVRRDHPLADAEAELGTLVEADEGGVLLEAEAKMLPEAELEAWTTRRTDASVTGGRLHRKRRKRRPSGCKAEGKPKEGEPAEDEGFCLVDAEGREAEGPRVRFDVSDAADTTDYNADADTDAGGPGLAASY